MGFHPGVTRDSVRQCDQQPNLFDVRNDPRRGTCAHRVGQRDRIETAVEKQHREILSQFLTNYFGSEQNRFVFVAVVSKYLFLIILLPPYLFCYGIPKWALFQLFPKVLDLTSRGLKKAKKSLHTISSWLVGHFSRLAASTSSIFIGTKKLVSEMRKKLVSRTAIRFHSVVDRLKRGVVSLSAVNEAIKRAVQQPARVVSAFLSEAFSQIKNRLATAQKKLYRAFERTVGPIRKAIETTLEPVSGGMKKLYDRTKEQLERLRHFLAERTEVMQSRVHSTVVATQAILNPVVNWFHLRATALFAPLQKGLNQAKVSVFAYMSHLASKAKEYTATMLNILVSPFQLGVQTGSHVISLFVQHLRSFGARLFRVPLERLSQRMRIVREIGLAFSRIFETARAKMQTKVAHMILRLKRFWQRGKRSLLWLKSKLQKVPKRLAFIIAKGVRFSFGFISALFAFIRFFLTLLWLLSLYGMQLLHEHATAILRSNKGGKSPKRG